MTYNRLTAAQNNILNVQRFFGGDGITNICGAVVFPVKYEKRLLEKAFNDEIRMLDSMRLHFCSKDGTTVQYISEYSYEEYEYVRFGSRDELTCFGNQCVHTLFKLNDEKMYNIVPFELDGRSGFILCASHLICDAWTCSMLTYDIIRRMSENEPYNISSYSYIEYIEAEEKYLHSSKYAEDKAYWENVYNICPEPSPVKIYNVSHACVAKRHTCVLPCSLIKEITAFSKAQRISPAVIFESAVIFFLSRVNYNNSSVTIGIPVLNRGSVREKRTAGMCVSTLPLTINMSGCKTSIDLCKRIAEGHRSIFRHRRYPYCDILGALRGKAANNSSLFDVMVSCQSAGMDIDASTTWFFSGYIDVPLSIHFDNRDKAEEYTLTIDYQTEVFNDEEAFLFSKRIIHILSQIVSCADTADISLLPDEEYKRLIMDFNNTEAAYKRDKSVNELFVEQAERYKDKVILVSDGREYTYGQLDMMSNAVAHRLINDGMKAKNIVAVMCVRSAETIAAILGILKAGGAYMPVSPSYPSERTAYMLKEAGASYILTYGCSYAGEKVIPLENIDFACDTNKINNTNAPDDLCYVIFTSGSTGKPKGTAICHRNVINYCSVNKYNICGGIIPAEELCTRYIVSVTNFIFDIFVTESILALLNGIKIILADEEQCVSQRRLAMLITRYGADIIQTTPTKMKSFITDKDNLEYLSGLKTIILGGEVFSTQLFDELKKYTSAEIYNIYGPAETTVWSSFSRADNSHAAIGKPVANTQIYILDSSKRLLPTGAAGELCIAGDGVGMGYLNRPELTAEKFTTNPFIEGGRMYRTGDLARINTDGLAEFLGRIDSQIKLHGLRIEPEEIESVMCGFDGINLAAVTVKTTDNGRQLLVGYFVSNGEIDIKALRMYLASRLPSYMTPSRLCHIESIPLTPSGKTDRKRLPEPDEAASDVAHCAPSTENERILCGIISSLLNVAEVGVEDDFFSLGGDSMSAIEFSSTAEEKNIFFSLQDVFECRSARGLCMRIDGGQANNNNDMQKDFLSTFPARRSKPDVCFFRLFGQMTKLLYKFEVYGKDNLVSQKKYIFCPNHESDLDCMWVLTALNKYADLGECCALITREHLEKRLPRRIFRITGGIPIDRNGDFIPSIKRSVRVLAEEKKCLLIHPEGTRTRSGELGHFKTGAAMLSAETGIEIVPVCIRGAHEILPPERKVPLIIKLRELKRYPLRISFGVPIKPEGKNLQQITEEIRTQIVSMTGEII